MVPHAWNEATLEQIKRSYVPAIPEDPVIDHLVDRIKRAALGGDYLQIKPNKPPFNGKINKEIIDPQSSAFINFFRQAVYQHIAAYENYFAIPGIPISYLAELCQDPQIILTPVLQCFAKRIGLLLPSELTQGMLPPSSVTIPIGGQLVKLPTDPYDPEILEIVELVTAELKKFI